MRGGTSKGLYFELDHLPDDRRSRNATLLKLLGEDHSQIDGLGGGLYQTSKVALVAKSKEKGIDLDYHFVQIMPGRGLDDKVPCGNILSGVGVFACEIGLIETDSPTTSVTIRDKNSGSLIEQVIQTPKGRVSYIGDQVLAGISRPAAPILIRYKNICAPQTGKLWPTGNMLDVIDNVPISLINAVIPVMMVPVESVGLPTNARLRVMHERRIIDTLLDLRKKITAKTELKLSNTIPKIAVVSEALHESDISVRYYTPFTPHRSLAVTGAISLAAAMAEPGSIASYYSKTKREVKAGRDETFSLEHVSGVMDLKMQFASNKGRMEPVHADLVRSARMLMRGTAYCPAN